MITKEEYEEAQQVVWDYEDQLKNNGVLGDVINDFYCLEHDDKTEKCKIQCPYCERI